MLHSFGRLGRSFRRSSLFWGFLCRSFFCWSFFFRSVFCFLFVHIYVFLVSGLPLRQAGFYADLLLNRYPHIFRSSLNDPCRSFWSIRVEVCHFLLCDFLKL